MFHNFTIRSNSETLKLISDKINRIGLREFLLDIEQENDCFKIKGLEGGSIKDSFFILSESYKEGKLDIAAATPKEIFVLDKIFKGITSQFILDIEYTFYCTKKEIAGKMSLINKNYDFNYYSDYQEICNDISYTLLEPKIIESLSERKILFKDISIEQIESKKVKTYGLGYIENKYKINIGQNNIFYNLSLDRVASSSDICPSRIVSKNNFKYIASSIGWSNKENFSIESSASDMDKELIIKSLFDIKSIFI